MALAGLGSDPAFARLRSADTSAVGHGIQWSARLADRLDLADSLTPRVGPEVTMRRNASHEFYPDILFLMLQ